MEPLYSSLDELSLGESEESSRRFVGNRKRCINGSDNDDQDDSNFKSKNLRAERRRRAKLNDRLLQLRTSVPIITNMTKAKIITDAITYIKELKRTSEDLSNELLEMGETHYEEEIKPPDEKNVDEDMKNWGIEAEVRVIPIDYNKLWIKVVYQKKLGGLTKLIEVLSDLDYEFNDVNLITSQGAAVLTCCLELGINDGSLDVSETKELLLNVVNSM